MIGTLRRELLDRLLIVNEYHLRQVLPEYLRHYNTARPRRALDQLTPTQAGTRPPEPVNLAKHRIRRKQVLQGLTHEYYVAALLPPYRYGTTHVTSRIVFPSPTGFKPTASGRRCIETDERAREMERLERDREFWRAVRDYSDATLDEGFENARKVAKLAGTIIPGPAGRGFKIAEKIFEGVRDAYVGAKLIEELVMEMSQSDALAHGSKELLKKGEDEFEKRADPLLGEDFEAQRDYHPQGSKGSTSSRRLASTSTSTFGILR